MPKYKLKSNKFSGKVLLCFIYFHFFFAILIHQYHVLDCYVLWRLLRNCTVSEEGRAQRTDVGVLSEAFPTMNFSAAMNKNFIRVVTLESNGNPSRSEIPSPP